MEKQIIVVAGGTGNLGGKIVTALVENGAEVRALVRSATDVPKLEQLKRTGASIVEVDFDNKEALAAACVGASCVVSALAGLEDVILTVQKTLLDAAIAAGVARFIPSDYSLDFTNFRHGENRNLDLRRQFHQYLDSTSMAATTIFNGAFMDMLTDEIPMIIFKKKWVLYWGDADHRMGFTTIADTARYTAHAAMDAGAPRYLRIAGDQVSPRQIRQIMNDISGEKFRLIRTGGTGLLSLIIAVTKKMAPAKGELYPAWQGMQYMRNMIDKRATLKTTDNNRYPGMQWTSVKGLLLNRRPLPK